jgi:hypothetical protein
VISDGDSTEDDGGPASRDADGVLYLGVAPERERANDMFISKVCCGSRKGYLESEFEDTND